MEKWSTDKMKVRPVFKFNTPTLQNSNAPFCFNIYAEIGHRCLYCLFSNFLTRRTNMCTALADNDPFNGCFAVRASVAAAAEYLQLITVASLVFCHGIKICFAGSQ
jgi:hypothetical protein